MGTLPKLVQHFPLRRICMVQGWGGALTMSHPGVHGTTRLPLPKVTSSVSAPFTPPSTAIASPPFSMPSTAITYAPGDIAPNLLTATATDIAAIRFIFTTTVNVGISVANPPKPASAIAISLTAAPITHYATHISTSIAPTPAFAASKPTLPQPFSPTTSVPTH